MCTSRASYHTQRGAGIVAALEKVYRHGAVVNSQSERWTEIGSTVPRMGAKILRGYVKDKRLIITSAINARYRANKNKDIICTIPSLRQLFTSTCRRWTGGRTDRTSH
jgi:hypothetical protein